MNKELIRLWEFCPHYCLNHSSGDCPHYNNGRCELNWEFPHIFPVKCGDFIQSQVLLPGE